jgi:hypothetical protein
MLREALDASISTSLKRWARKRRRKPRLRSGVQQAGAMRLGRRRNGPRWLVPEHGFRSRQLRSCKPRTGHARPALRMTKIDTFFLPRRARQSRRCPHGSHQRGEIHSDQLEMGMPAGRRLRALFPITRGPGRLQWRPCAARSAGLSRADGTAETSSHENVRLALRSWPSEDFIGWWIRLRRVSAHSALYSPWF